MYIQNRRGLSGNLGIAPVVIAAQMISWVSSFFGKKPWTYGLVAEVNRRAMGGFFAVYAYLNRSDRIQYWFNLITTTKGIGIDSGPNYIHQLHLETVKFAVDAKISLVADYPSFTPGSVAQALYEKGYSHPIADDGSWSVPADLIPSTSQTQDQAQQTAQVQQPTAQASMFSGFFPIALIGGVVYLVAKKMRVI